MPVLQIENYTAHHQEAWDEFVARSKNATFLFRRSYMDYHADRHPDASLVIRDEGGRLLSLLPASRKGSELISHSGLTYGGFLTDGRMTVELMLDVFKATLEHLARAGIETLVYKTIPHIYHRSPAEEDLYGLFRCEAELVRRDVLSVIDYSGDGSWAAGWRYRLRKAGKAERAGVVVRNSAEYERLWELLTINLQRRYGVRPVHSLDEIRLLAARFPEQIQMTGAYRGSEMYAGAVSYLCGNTFHVQYSASTEEGRELRALDLLYARLIESANGTFRYFDFGISNEEDGRVLNAGLIDYKQRFGARAVAHDFYRLSVGRE